MSLRTEYIRNFYADHQANFGQPDGAPAAAARAAVLREFDEWLRGVKAEAWDEGSEAGFWAADTGNVPPPNPYRASEEA